MTGNKCILITYRNRNSVLKCLRETVDSCAGASEVLAFWGHQQDLLDDALDLLCKNIDGKIFPGI